jgi:hypothetical protein
MSAKTELDLRPLEAHELDIVNGAYTHIQAPAGGVLGYLTSPKIDLITYAWEGQATPVSKPIESLATSYKLADEVFWPH